MKMGLSAAFMSPPAPPQMIRDFGRRAESMGLDSIWMGEHVALFDKNTFGYPGSKDGRIPVPDGGAIQSSANTELGERAGRMLEIVAVSARDRKKDRGFDHSHLQWSDDAA